MDKQSHLIWEAYQDTFAAQGSNQCHFCSDYVSKEQDMSNLVGGDDFPEGARCCHRCYECHVNQSHTSTDLLYDSDGNQLYCGDCRVSDTNDEYDEYGDRDRRLGI